MYFFLSRRYRNRGATDSKGFRSWRAQELHAGRTSAFAGECSGYLLTKHGALPIKGTRIAPGEAWERGARCKDHLKTFQLNPAGIQSRPAELGQQPEASLASCAGNPPDEA